MRTMEFARRWGIVDWVENSPYPRDYPQDNAYVTALTGFEFEREPFPSMADAVNLPQTPQRRERCPQNMFDPILTRFALSQESVAIRYRTEVVGITEHGEAVQVSVKNGDTGEIEELTASYVVGCDGGDSGVRQLLGIERSGSPVLTYTTNVIFRCPNLEELHDKRCLPVHLHRPGRHLRNHCRHQRQGQLADVDYRERYAPAAVRQRYSCRNPARGRHRLRLRDPLGNALDPQRADRRQVPSRPGFPGWGRSACDVADGRLRNEHRNRGRRRPVLEAGCGPFRLGRPAAAGLL